MENTNQTNVSKHGLNISINTEMTDRQAEIIAQSVDRVINFFDNCLSKKREEKREREERKQRETSSAESADSVVLKKILFKLDELNQENRKFRGELSALQSKVSSLEKKSK